MPADDKVDQARVLISLYKGVVYRDADEAHWSRLLALQASVVAHFSAVGLEVCVDESEGFAFLRTRVQPDGEELPRLVTRRQLTYSVSLLLALLRKKMIEADAGGSDARLILTRDEAVDLVRVFLPAGTNEAKVTDQVTAALGKVEELGFVRRLAGHSETFEVRRILKAFVDAQWLAEFDARLESYRNPSEAS